MKEVVVWLDDMRDPFTEAWHPVATNRRYIKGEPVIVWLKNHDEFTAWLDRQIELPSLFCFDHDLGEEKSGFDCVKYLVDFCMDHDMELPPCTCHSSNPAGRENILSYIDSYKKSLQK